MGRSAPGRVVVAAAWMAAVATVAGQPPERVYRSAIDLTAVNATVVDREGRLVKGLPREVFEVYEDGRAQVITQFANERVPISIGILFDISDSMFGRRLDEARDAVERFVVESLDPSDEFSLRAFNHQQHPLTEWTGDRGAAPRVLRPLKPFGATAIYDALHAALPQIESRHRQRAALLVVSDGADTASDVSLRQIRSALLRSDAFVYAIAIDTPDPRPINRQVNPSALRDITDQSGGRTLVVQSAADAVTALTSIADELNSQYLIGYSSPKGADGQYHSIRVRVRGDDYRVRARNGYVARVADTMRPR